MDHSVFFYTYSTIAQTLAGALGFLTAIVLYRVQHISGTVIPGMESGRGQVIETMQRSAESPQLPFADRMGQRMKLYHDIEVAIRRQERTMDSVKTMLIRSLHATVFVISWCLVAMPLTPALGRLGSWAPWPPLVPAVAGVIACLGLYVRMTVAVVKLDISKLLDKEQPASSG